MTDEFLRYYLWCHNGFEPKDVAQGKCERYNERGCDECKHWKLKDSHQSKIIVNEKGCE